MHGCHIFNPNELSTKFDAVSMHVNALNSICLPLTLTFQGPIKTIAICSQGAICTSCLGKRAYPWPGLSLTILTSFSINVIAKVRMVIALVQPSVTWMTNQLVKPFHSINQHSVMQSSNHLWLDLFIADDVFKVVIHFHVNIIVRIFYLLSYQFVVLLVVHECEHNLRDLDLGDQIQAS